METNTSHKTHKEREMELPKMFRSIEFVNEVAVLEGHVMGNDHKVEIFTECQKRESRHRSHPNHKSGGSWHDWCMVRFETESPSENQAQGHHPHDNHPCKTLCFYRSMLKGTPSGLKAVVHSCKASDHASDSVITERWELEYDESGKPTTHHVDVETLGDPVLVLEEHGPVPHEKKPSWSNGFVHLVINRENGWSTEFVG